MHAARTHTALAAAAVLSGCAAHADDQAAEKTCGESRAAMKSRRSICTVGEDMPSAVYEGGRSIFANGDWRLLAVCTPDIDHTYAVALNPSSGKILW